MWDLIPADWAAAFVIGAISYVGHKLWGRASDKQKQILNSAMGEIRSIIRSLVLTAKPGTTVDQIVIWGKGAVAVQLAKRGLNPDNKLVAALTDQLIAEGVTLFVDLHPEKQTVAAPILKKLAPAT